MKNLVAQLQSQFQNSATGELLRYFYKEYPGRIALASSLGVEDQVLTDLILKIEPKARIFTLDTGRLPQETYNTINDILKSGCQSKRLSNPGFFGKHCGNYPGL